jgi:hypothetical protein
VLPTVRKNQRKNVLLDDWDETPLTASSPLGARGEYREGRGGKAGRETSHRTKPAVGEDGELVTEATDGFEARLSQGRVANEEASLPVRLS